jgi:hypothetical protein
MSPHGGPPLASLQSAAGRRRLAPNPDIPEIRSLARNPVRLNSVPDRKPLFAVPPRRDGPAYIGCPLRLNSTRKAKSEVSLMAEERAGPAARLFRYDRRIAINAARATFSGWHDRLIAATMLLFALAAAHSWLLDRAWPIAAWTAFGVGVMVGLTAGRLIAVRLAFHTFDGPLAADALCPALRKHYLIAWFAIGLTLLAIFTTIARPSLLIAILPGYLIGSFVGHVIGNFSIAGFGTGKAGFGRMLRSWIQRPGAGIVAAAILLLSLAFTAQYLRGDALVVVAGIETALTGLALTIVDDSSVRFQTIAGRGAWRIIGRQARGATLFVGIATPVCALAFGTTLAAVVAATSIAALLLMVLRTLAYRIHGKGFADLIVSILTGLLILTAFSMPIVLPFVGIVILWQLQRRSTARAWLLA